MNTLPFRALLLDLGRNLTGRLSYLTSVIDRLSEFGFNALCLNLEYRFDFPSAPGLAPPGSLTPDDARALCAYGAERGVRVIAQPNLLGHFEGAGATERYAHLTVDRFDPAPWGGVEQVNLDLPEARKLIPAMLQDVLEAFPGDYLHIGLDEVRRMDLLYPGDPARQETQLIEHFRFLLDTARASGRTIIFWADMPLKHPRLLEALPRDLVFCDWTYRPEGRRETQERLRDAGCRFIVAPGVRTWCSFAVDPSGTFSNVRRLLTDGAETGAEGFLLTTWHFGWGSGPELIWPWVAMTGAIAAGNEPADADAWLATWLGTRYGVDGQALVRLYHLLGEELESVLATEDGDTHRTRRVRELMFRGTDYFIGLARSQPLPPNYHHRVTEGYPFQAWRYLRPILDADRFRRLSGLAAEAERIANALSRTATSHAGELKTLFGLVDTLSVLVRHVDIIEEACQSYHEAACVQKKDPDAFRGHLAACASRLESLRPGLDRLRRHVRHLVDDSAVDPGQYTWLDLQQASLDEHVAALRRRRPEEDSLLEFGEFLNRPVGMTGRLTWR